MLKRKVGHCAGRRVLINNRACAVSPRAGSLIAVERSGENKGRWRFSRGGGFDHQNGSVQGDYASNKRRKINRLRGRERGPGSKSYLHDRATVANSAYEQKFTTITLLAGFSRATRLLLWRHSNERGNALRGQRKISQRPVRPEHTASGNGRPNRNNNTL